MLLNTEGLTPEEIIAKIQSVVAIIEQIRQEVNNYIKAALAAGVGADAISLMAALAKDVATGGTDPAAILDTIQKLVGINNDLTAAAAAVKAQAPAA